MIKTVFAKLNDPALDRFLGQSCEIFTSLEGENPGGSIKDRMVIGSLAALRESGRLVQGTRIVEASAGSTASSLAYYCRQQRVDCALFVPDTLDQNRLAELRAAGADVHALSATSNWEAVFAEFSAQPGVIALGQHTDPGKTAFYHELGRDVAALGDFELLIGAVGTGHSLLGAGEGIQASTHTLRVTAEPAAGVSVSGIRNLDVTRHGSADICRPEIFDQRVVLGEEAFFPGKSLVTTLGVIEFPDSFRVTLGALRVFIHKQKVRKVFALGASNRRVGLF